MPRFILINEQTRCARFLTHQEIRNLVDVNRNPGGYTDVDRCLAMIMNPPPGQGYMSFPLTYKGVMHSINVEGRLDVDKSGSLKYRPADHECTARCYVEAQIPKKEREIIRRV